MPDDDDLLDELLGDGDPVLPKPSLEALKNRKRLEAMRQQLLHQRAPKKMMLTFEKGDDTGDLGRGYERIYWAQPQLHFKPKGLMIWGVPDDGDVTHIWIGRRLQVVASLGSIPAKWFTTAQSYEQVAKALENGIEPPSWPDFDVVMTAMEVQVHIRTRLRLDDNAKIVMWGLGIES